MPNLNTFINHFRNGFQPDNRFLCQIETTKIFNAIKNQVAATVRTGIVGAIEDLVGTLFGEANNDIGFAADMLARGLLCTGVHLPSRTIQTTVQTMYGFSEHFPVGTGYAPLDCAFMLPLFGTKSAIINSLEDRLLGKILPDNINVFMKNPTTNPLPAFFSAWQNLMQNATNGPESGFNLSFPDDYYTTAHVVTFDRQDNATLTYQFNKVFPVSVEAVPLQWGSDSFAAMGVSFQYSHWQIIKTNPSKLSISIGGIPLIGGGTITF
jgi:hypothetical protein